VPNFVEKVIQLHETLKVRFGVMLVGATLGGKSQCLNVLRLSYMKLFEHYRLELKNVSHPVYQMIEQQVLNPKAISMEELYGQFDIMTQQWTDGLASNIMRGYSSLDTADKKWVVFDGPVDALWIENMNTVLDDSMTLCLSNGERVKLKP
jgi:dynein heavy chain